jgi:hypothetical protein
VDQLDREIQEIRRLMVESMQEIVRNRRRLTRGEPVVVA